MSRKYIWSICDTWKSYFVVQFFRKWIRMTFTAILTMHQGSLSLSRLVFECYFDWFWSWSRNGSKSVMHSFPVDQKWNCILIILTVIYFLLQICPPGMINRRTILLGVLVAFTWQWPIEKYSCWNQEKSENEKNDHPHQVNRTRVLLERVPDWSVCMVPDL